MISKFDPWHSSLCTCPSKLTFNPYTGCDHACVYCYATSYIPKFFGCRPKKELIPGLKKEAEKLKGEMVSISNSSDPYPPGEAERGLMRNCLKLLVHSDCRIQIITKSNIVVRDIDLLKEARAMVSVTITTDNDELSRLIEPKAPLPSQRLKAVETLIEKGVPTSVRIDPVIPFVNDHPEKLIETLASIGVKHVTGSTYKVRPDNWRRLCKALPKGAEKLEPLYFENGERISSYVYLPEQLRFKLMKDMGSKSEQLGVKFGTCRENLSCLNTATCDGSWLIK